MIKSLLYLMSGLFVCLTGWLSVYLPMLPGSELAGSFGLFIKQTRIQWKTMTLWLPVSNHLSASQKNVDFLSFLPRKIVKKINYMLKHFEKCFLNAAQKFQVSEELKWQENRIQWPWKPYIF